MVPWVRVILYLTHGCVLTPSMEPTSNDVRLAASVLDDLSDSVSSFDDSHSSSSSVFRPHYDPFRVCCHVFRTWVIRTFDDRMDWYAVPPLQWRWFYDENRSYAVRFQLFSFLFQNGCSPDLTYEICLRTDRAASPGAHYAHYNALRVKANTTPTYWYSIPYYDTEYGGMHCVFPRACGA